jgi:hypothetical protein
MRAFVRFDYRVNITLLDFAVSQDLLTLDSARRTLGSHRRSTIFPETRLIDQSRDFDNEITTEETYGTEEMPTS